MANHLYNILSQWYPARDSYRWVLASVIGIEGSNYRKTGAMMLINELGQYYGLISGGCLEKTLLNDVKKVLTYDRPLRVCFDSSEGGEMPWARALGCGGRVTILLQPVCVENHYQALDLLYLELNTRTERFYSINIHADTQPSIFNQTLNADEAAMCGINSSISVLKNNNGDEMLVLAIQPPVHLLIFGGGVDAIPLVQMAHILGWQITLVDNRTGYADAKSFPHAHIIRSAADAPELIAVLASIDAAILMTHNISLDAEALLALQSSSAHYIGLLGPVHRKQKVLQHAGLTVDAAIYGPMGFDIGGDLPESVALSVLAQCHQVLQARAQPCEQVQPELRRHLN